MSDPVTRVLSEPGKEGLRLPGIRLVVLEGPDRGRQVTARRGVIRVGTAADNDLALTDPAVSRRHLELRLRADGVRVVDLGSTNGTRVDTVRIVEAVLSPEARIRLGDTVLRALPVEEPVVIPLSTRERFGGLLGRSPAMREVFGVLERVAPLDVTVLLEGETGTGKDLAADAIHAHSPRADGPFVALDCGAVVPELLESALFGHVRDAFDGAVTDRRGVFEEADGGTLFLDAIGELPRELQARLLRVLEAREVVRVGDEAPRPVDVRIVAATHRDLAAETNRGGFREDLYFRLAVVRVTLPPLRARAEDVPLLVRHFVSQFAPGTPDLPAEMVAALAARAWRGNVRELRNAVERAVALARPDLRAEPPRAAAGADDLESLLTLPVQDALDRHVERFERAYLDRVLAVSGGSVSGAARLAGTNRRFIQRMMRRHGRTAGTEPDDGV